MGNGVVGRKRLPPGERVIDKYKNLIINGIPIDIYKNIELHGKPNEVILRDIIEKYGKK